METFRADRAHPPSLGPRGGDPRLRGGRRPLPGARVQRGRGAQRLRAQARHAGHGGPQGRGVAGPPRHGAAEEQRQDFRLRAGPHRRLHRRRLGDGRRHDARGRQRHRRGCDSRRAGGQHAGPRPAGGALHRHRGDRHGRRLRAQGGPSAGRHPAQPRLGDRGRTLRGLRRRSGRQHHARLRHRARTGRLQGLPALCQGAQGRPLGHPDRGSACQRQQAALPSSEPHRGRVDRLGRRRRVAQRHPARGRGRGHGARRRGVRGCGGRLREDRAGRICRRGGCHPHLRRAVRAAL